MLTPELKRKLRREAYRRGLIPREPKASLPPPERQPTTSYQEWLKSLREPGYNWDWRYQKLLCETLERVQRREIKRLIIQIPVRHGKSENATVRYPVYRLLTEPELQVVTTANTQDLAEKFGRKSKAVAGRVLSISQDRKAAREWTTDTGARYRSVGVGGTIIGDGFDLLICDDPIKSREEAENLRVRNSIWEWFTQDLYSRRNHDDSQMIVIMSRWHEDDLVGRLHDQFPGEWTTLDLQAECEDPENDPLGRELGEALEPERMSLEELHDRRLVHGEYHYRAQYQQRPSAKEGTLFRVTALSVKRREECPPPKSSVLAWDLGATENDGDWTAGAHIWRSEGIYYIEVVQFRHEPFRRDEKIRIETAAFKPGTVIVPQDPGAAGKQVAKISVQKLAGFNVTAQLESGDKYLRAEPLAAQVNGGNVVIILNEFTKPFIEQLRQVPNSTHDDMMDAAATAFNRLCSSSTLIWRG